MWHKSQTTKMTMLWFLTLCLCTANISAPYNFGVSVCDCVWRQVKEACVLKQEMCCLFCCLFDPGLYHPPFALRQHFFLLSDTRYRNPQHASSHLFERIWQILSPHYSLSLSPSLCAPPCCHRPYPFPVIIYAINTFWIFNPETIFQRFLCGGTHVA